MPTSKEPIINVIRRRREMIGMSRSQIADIAGMSEKTYLRIERGDSDMRLSQYRTIIRALKLTDLDISLDILEIDTTTPWDVAAAARILSPEARLLLVKLVMTITLDLEPPGR